MSDQNPQQAGMERMQARYKGKEPPLLCPAGFPVAPGTKEWVVEKGEQGAKGDKGERGERGMPAGQRRAIVYLFVLNFVLFVVLGLGLLHYVHTSEADQRAQTAEQQAVQRRAGALVEKALCADVGTMAAIRPPPGAAAANPSRAYEQAEHRAWSGLLGAIGCKGPS